MKSILVIIALFLVLTVKADQPPCWCDFSVKSVNKLFVAHIKGVKDSSLKYPPYGQWEIQVYKKKSVKDSTLLWKSHYLYDGYTDGLLSDDGQYFVYVNFWYQNQAPVIQLYKAGKHSGSISGAAFNIPTEKIPATVSHKLWLSRNGQPYEFITHDKKNYLLRVTTIDGKEHLIDCANAKLMKF